MNRAARKGGYIAFEARSLFEGGRAAFHCAGFALKAGLRQAVHRFVFASNT